MSKEKVAEWMTAFKDPERRAAWLKKSTRKRAASKVAQARVQKALDSDEPQAALDALYLKLIEERKNDR